MSDLTFTKDDQIKTVYKGNPHIVILGAGASIASTLHNPEKNNFALPSMDTIIQVLGLEVGLKEVLQKHNSNNFEAIFSKLFEEDPNSILLKNLEHKVYQYFDQLELPNTPTIYDYLILSLRKKDLIATFNWDPFLWQAYLRNSQFTENLPHLAFLHGNVAIGVDEESKTFGPKGLVSLKSNKPFMPIKLLYPITKKDYKAYTYIEDQWNMLSQGLERPARVTVFGYSAPKSDYEAIQIMKKAYDKSKIKMFTEFEIVDIQNKEILENSWKDFLYSHHYETHSSFFESSIFMFPRRTGEVFWENKIEAKFYETNEPPLLENLDDLWEWYYKFLEYEEKVK